MSAQTRPRLQERGDMAQRTGVLERAWSVGSITQAFSSALAAGRAHAAHAPRPARTTDAMHSMTRCSASSLDSCWYSLIMATMSARQRQKVQV